jgi:hypothetical protein
MVSSVPSEKLKEIVEKNGETILLNPSRCEGLLKDHCGSHRREISAIVGALEERVPMELRSSWQSAMTPEAMRARMVQRLEENRGLAPEVAGWAVDAWSYALGVGLERKSDRIDDKGPASVVVGMPGAIAATNDKPRDLHGDRAPGMKAAAAAAILPPVIAQMKPQKKAGIGAVAALALVAGGYALWHHPQPIPNPGPGPAPIPQPVPGPSPAPKPQPGPGPQGDVLPPKPMIAKPSLELAIGTPVAVSLNEELSSDNLQVGQMVAGTVAAPLTLGGNVVIPRGATATMRVTEVDESGKYAGRSRINVTLVELNSAGRHYHVSTSGHFFEGPSQAVHTAERSGVGAAIGGVAGFLGGKLLHHGKAGTLIGAGGGATVGAVTNKPAPVHVRAETVVEFRLAHPLGVGVSS